MSQWFSLDFRCPLCQYEFDDIVPRAEVDQPVLCKAPDCAGLAVRIPSKPNPTRKSFLDGTRRFTKLREQDAIDRAISETRPGEGAERQRLVVERNKVTKQVKDPK